MARCGKCPNCLELERVRKRVMACANPPFSHADDDVAGLWNRELERLPCTADHIRLSGDQLPPPPEGVEVLRKRYRMSANDWWLETDKGWYWLDLRQMTWKPSVYGPD